MQYALPIVRALAPRYWYCVDPKYCRPKLVNKFQFQMLRQVALGLPRSRVANPSFASRHVISPLRSARFSAPLAQPLGVRHKSDIATEIGKVSEPVSDAAANAASVVSQVSPDQIGYFQSVGLAQGWFWPEYIFQHAMEYVHVYTGMPWWATIVTLALTTRCLMLPLYLSSSSLSSLRSWSAPRMPVISVRFRLPCWSVVSS